MLAKILAGFFIGHLTVSSDHPAAMLDRLLFCLPL